MDIPFDEQFKEAFRLGASGYYNQPAQWDGRYSSLDTRRHPERSTFASWTRAQQERWTEDFPARSDLPIM